MGGPNSSDLAGAQGPLVDSPDLTDAGETHETIHWESGMRYQVSSSPILSTNWAFSLPLFPQTPAQATVEIGDAMPSSPGVTRGRFQDRSGQRFRTGVGAVTMGMD